MGSTREDAGKSTIRIRINEVDAHLLRLLAERRDLARQVATAKTATGKSLRDQEREEDVLVRLVEDGRAIGLDAHYVTRLFHAIIDDSLRTQQRFLQTRAAAEGGARPIRVAFQGDKGSYSHTAICEHFSADIERVVFLGFDAFASVVEAVEKGAADYACLPIENTTSGGINEVYDLLMHTSLSIVGEQRLRVAHCLLARESIPLSALRRIYAHPQGFAQCSRFISRLSHCRLEYHETAECVRLAGEDEDGLAAAIASREAGEANGLQVLEADIANQKENFTRFLVAARQPREVPLQIGCTTSLVMATAHEPGSLVEALLLFRERNINLSKLESRPMPGNPWEEMFYLDLEGNRADPRVQDALERLGKATRFMKVLGSYASDALPPTAVPPAALAGAGRSASAGQVSRAEVPHARVGFRAGSARIGAGLVVAAGPQSDCPEGSQAGLAALAREHGAQMLWVGGQGDNAAMLEASVAGTSASLPIIATARSAEDIAKLLPVAQMIHVAGQDMHKRSMLDALGRVHCPVLLERHPNASAEEWLAVAHETMALGNRQIALCDTPARSLDGSQTASVDFAALLRLREEQRLPVFINLAAAASDAAAIAPLALAAAAAGIDGLIVSLGDAGGPRGGGLSEPDFRRLMTELYR